MKIKDFISNINSFIINYGDYKYEFSYKEIIRKIFGNIDVPVNIYKNNETSKYDIMISYEQLIKTVTPEKIKEAVAADKRCKEYLEKSKTSNAMIFIIITPITFFLMCITTFLLSNTIFKNAGDVGIFLITLATVLVYGVIFGSVMLFLEFRYNFMINKILDRIKA